MDNALMTAPPETHAHGETERSHDLAELIEHACHFLPTQGPIQVFIHHNTLHAFEHLPFDEAVRRAGSLYGCHPYLPEDRYRQHLASGRIRTKDLEAVLRDELGTDGDRAVSFLGTRSQLRLALLMHSIRLGPENELRWLIAETDALRRFRPEVRSTSGQQVIDLTRRWVMRDLRGSQSIEGSPYQQVFASLVQQFGETQIESWSNDTWEAFSLHALWRICHQGVHGLPRFAAQSAAPLRHRDLLLQATGVDADRLVHELLIRYSAAYLDQGVAGWPIPVRELGFFEAFVALYKDSRSFTGWLSGLGAELQRIHDERFGPLAVIQENLERLGVKDHETDEYLTQTLLALRGWAGMVRQMETNAEWTVHPAPRGATIGFTAVRLLLDRLAVEHVAKAELGNSADLHDLRSRARPRTARAGRVSVDQRAFFIFQLAQLMGWSPEVLSRMSKADWYQLVEEIEAFSGLQRRRLFHLAFERRYRAQALDAIVAHAKHTMPQANKTRFQICCCIDEREESFRRHLEEVEPGCETFAFAGFFAVAMYYRGAVDAHFVPLCPIVVKPQHYVREEAVYSLEAAHRARTKTRRALGKATHQFHLGSRSSIAGALASIVGSLASLPLVARVLFPRLTAQIRRTFGSFMQPPPVTRLALERTHADPGPSNGQLGFSLPEMTDIVERVLRDIGLTSNLSRLVIIAGHGSASLNNPHRAAYDCGACGGGCGGPNARAFAFMANNPRVRDGLAARGLEIPADTFFVGAMHNTCDDSMTYLDLDRLPPTHRDDFEAAHASIEEALKRNAQERCRRFESAPLSITPEAARRHVEGRSEDLAQVRPELGHATNAMCYVGRRWRCKGLFMDRRAFLTSYDPTQDDERNTLLTRILQPVIPVCAGISLEYFFSYVDSPGYGCGTKLPHNITSLLGVMDGPASDLRPGLPWQMVEIHEPLRILFLIESTPESLLAILEDNPPIKQLVANEWVQLAVLDPHSPAIQFYRRGKFEPYTPESTQLPAVGSSIAWYRGSREHLGFASVLSSAANQQQEAA